MNLVKHCEEAARIVSTWPAWKRGVLEASMRSTNDESRPPVINDGTPEERGLRREIVELKSVLSDVYKDLKYSDVLSQEDTNKLIKSWVERLEKLL